MIESTGYFLNEIKRNKALPVELIEEIENNYPRVLSEHIKKEIKEIFQFLDPNDRNTLLSFSDADYKEYIKPNLQIAIDTAHTNALNECNLGDGVMKTLNDFSHSLWAMYNIRVIDTILDGINLYEGE